MRVIDQRGDLASFRAALKTWLSNTVPNGWQAQMTGASDQEFMAFQKWWFSELVKEGLATPHWPVAWGGLDVSITEQVIIFEEMARAGAPDPVMYSISLYHVPATLAKWGSPEQVERYIPGVRRGEVWCQGFSEPNAGSDLASLRTRAVRQGDKFVVNGQKVWSSYAVYADYYLLLARTDAAAPKHQGISYFILDLKSPGITVRPIKQMNGMNEFCEVFLDNVEIPAENLIGPENGGWAVAQTTLSAERGLILFAHAERVSILMERLLSAPDSARWTSDSQLRREFMACYADMQATRALIRRMLTTVEHGGGELPPIVKIVYGETLMRFTELCTRIEGLDALIDRPTYISGGYAKGNWMSDYLGSWVWTISGGTNEVLRNVIAERQLGLPREPRMTSPDRIPPESR